MRICEADMQHLKLFAALVSKALMSVKSYHPPFAQAKVQFLGYRLQPNQQWT